MVVLTLMKCCEKSELKSEDILDISHYEDQEECFDEEDYPLEGYRTKYYNIHCTASKQGVDLDGEWFKRFFREERGWKKCGYNAIIRLDGTIDTLHAWDYDGFTTLDELTNGVKGKNRHSLNFAYVGGVDENLKPKDTRTTEQIFAIAILIHNIKMYDPEAQIMGHRDHDGVKKACPSFDVRKTYMLER